MNKRCVICRNIFNIKENAITAETRTLCPKCRESVKTIGSVEK